MVKHADSCQIPLGVPVMLIRKAVVVTEFVVVAGVVACRGREVASVVLVVAAVVVAQAQESS